MWFRDFFHLIFKTISHHPNFTPAGVTWSSAINCRSRSRARSVHDPFETTSSFVTQMKALWIIFWSLWQFLKLKLSGMGEHHWFWSGQHKSQHRCFLELLLQILGFALQGRVAGSCHVTRVLLWGGWETTGPVTQKTSENQKKAGVRASDSLDWRSFVPEPSTEPGRAMLGSGWASFSPSLHRLPHWKSRGEIFHSFCFVLWEENVALQEDERRRVRWVRKPGSPPCFLSNGGIWPGRIGLFRTLPNEFLYPMVIWLPSQVYGVER